MFPNVSKGTKRPRKQPVTLEFERDSRSYTNGMDRRRWLWRTVGGDNTDGSESAVPRSPSSRAGTEFLLTRPKDCCELFDVTRNHKSV